MREKFPFLSVIIIMIRKALKFTFIFKNKSLSIDVEPFKIHSESNWVFVQNFKALQTLCVCKNM